MAASVSDSASGPQGPGRRAFNEAAHKLGDRTPVRRESPEPAAPSEALRRATDQDRDVVPDGAKVALAIGALGVVYGDIGTSPLYTEQTIFTAHRAIVHTSVADVYGVVSLIFWALMVVVSIKYAGFIMRAHNHGDGGIMALTALVKRRRVPHSAVLITLGIFGAGLFFGDGMITPAISVLSAVQGVDVVTPSLAHLVVPLSLGILIGLFAVQARGTDSVGRFFGPVILLWFLVIAVLGGHEVALHPGVIAGLSPTWAVRFLIAHGVKSFLVLGGVVLAVTGAEALYADRGHFGARAIRSTWFLIVLPAVVLCYLGQAALVRARPSTIANPFFLLVPHALLIPMVVLATAATIIASQAAITGSFSVAKQAVQLNFLPRLKILRPSEHEGQVYVPIINWFLCLGVVVLILVFRSSDRLADIYGVAVTATFMLNTVLFVAVARALWRTPKWQLALLATLFLTVETLFFASNLLKVTDGAWLSLAVGSIVAFLMMTWRRGGEILTRRRTEEEGSLAEFLVGLASVRPAIERLPGTVVFLSPGKQTTPLAMRAEVEHAHAFHERVLIVSVEQITIPRVDPQDRLCVEWIGDGVFKVSHVTFRVGYRERADVPAALALARKQGLLERSLDLEHASYFVSRMTIALGPTRWISRWRKRLFIVMARNAGNSLTHFGLPIERTVIMGTQVTF